MQANTIQYSRCDNPDSWSPSPDSGVIECADNATATRLANYWNGCNTITCFFIEKYRNQAILTGYLRTAKCMRKQGISCEIALLILLYAEAE